MEKKRMVRSVILGMVVGMLSAGTMFVQAEDESVSEIVVLYHPDYAESVRSFAKEQEDGTLNEIARTEDVTVAVVTAEDSSAEEMAEQYKTETQVIAASPNYELELFATPEVNDSDYTKQSYLQQEAAVQAWKMLSLVPHEKVRVAVLDTGADVSHPDLINILNLSLSGEVLSESGQMGPLLGDGYVNGAPSNYAKSHGTHVSGIIAAESNNGQGIAGAGSAYDNSVIDLMVVDVFNKENKTSLAYLIQGMEHARACGAKVINLSLGLKLHPGIDDSVLYEECERLKESGIILVCAAGNYGEDDQGQTVVVPSDYDNTISVSAVDHNNHRLGTSNYGSRKDLAAPGANIFSTVKEGKYSMLSGTSMAAPSVTAAVAMMCSVDPTLTTEAIRDILQKNATDLGIPGMDRDTAFGLLNMRRSLEAAIPEESVQIQLPYEDVNTTDWFYDNLSYLYQYGLMTGLQDTVFGPSELICRGQIAVILYRYAGNPETPYQGYFSDVPEGQFYTQAVEWAAANGIVKGYEDSGLFGPVDPVTREQLAALLYRYASNNGYAVPTSGNIHTFPDANAVNLFAEEAMQWAVGKQIIRGYGDGTLSPQNTAERAVCATMIKRFMGNY